MLGQRMRAIRAPRVWLFIVPTFRAVGLVERSLLLPLESRSNQPWSTHISPNPNSFSLFCTIYKYPNTCRQGPQAHHVQESNVRTLGNKEVARKWWEIWWFCFGENESSSVARSHVGLAQHPQSRSIMCDCDRWCMALFWLASGMTHLCSGCV